MEEMRVLCKRKEVPVVLERENGEERHVLLREMSGKMRDDYLTGIAGKMRYNSQGKPAGLKSFQDLQAGLLSFCLYEGEELVPLKEIREFPASVQKTLFEKAQKMNALEKEDLEETVKNA